MKNILITGKPKVGKTTLIKNVIKKIKISKGGFYTEEIKNENRRIGFKIITLSGKEGILSHINFNSPFKVGKYKVDLENFENVGVKSIGEAIKNKDLIVIDEIGKMELYSKKFKNMVLKALNCRKLVLATIKLGSNSFIDTLKQRRDIIIFELTLKNRNEILSNLLKKLQNHPV